MIGAMDAGLKLPAKKASKPTPYARLIGCGKNGHISFQSLVLGCPPKWNMHDERRILRSIKQNTRMEWKDVMKGLVVDFSKDHTWAELYVQLLYSYCTNIV
jgi:hypothetical protein